MENQNRKNLFFSLEEVDLLVLWTTSQSLFSVFRFSVKRPGQSIWGRPGVSYFECLSLSSVCSTPQIEGYNVGEHPLVVQLLKGIFNSRPPAPRYTYKWDVSKVTSYLESLGPNEQLSLKRLSRKLAFLLAITSAERGSELVAHDLRFKRFHPEGVSFNLPELTKTVQVGKPLKTSFHASFPENKFLFPCSCLREYEMRTSAFRPESVSVPNKLFLSVNNPHKPVSSATLSHWFTNCLLEAGINSQVFKAHSTRGAATSAALRAGISILEIVRLADWTNETTFKKFFTVLFGTLVLVAPFHLVLQLSKDLEALNIHCYIETSIMTCNWRLYKGCLQPAV